MQKQLGNLWVEQLPGLWNKVFSRVASQCACSLLPDRQLGGWDCSQGTTDWRTIAFPGRQLISQREGQQQCRDSVGRACACFTQLHSYDGQGGGFFEGVQWNRRSFCKEGVMYREGAKEQLHSPQCVASTTQEVCFPSSAENQLNLPQPVTNASICKMTERNA